MADHVVSDKERIRETIDYLVSHEKRIVVQTEGEETSFRARVVKVINADHSSRSAEEPVLIIERLVPEQGNTLIKSGSQQVARFSLRGISLSFSTRYLGTSDDSLHSNFIVSFP